MIRKLLCWLGKHEWFIQKRWTVNINNGTCKYKPKIWCKHCGKEQEQ